MRFKPCRQLAVILVCASAAPVVAGAQPKHKAESAEVSDKTMDKQMAWESKVMGEDRAKQADMKKIAAAQKISDEARKHPAPEPAPKVKDPNKEGVRAKQEAAIGLPIASDEAANRHSKKAPSAKRAEPSGSANDELGALVASSLASEKSSNAQGDGSSKASGGKGKAKRPGKSAAAPSALDKIFSN
jgi:hypothetical protein